MAVEQTSLFCPQCQQQRLFTRSGFNSLMHLIISFFLCGLWIPVWLILASTHHSQPYFCSVCGLTNRQINTQGAAQSQITATQIGKAYAAAKTTTAANGDWFCSNCDEMNVATRKWCTKCGATK
jgi:hypothetical protein